MAAFFYENAAIDLRQNVVGTKFGDLWLRFYYRNAAICPVLAAFFYENAAIDLHLSFLLHLIWDL